jgi:hypothetical protein
VSVNPWSRRGEIEAALLFRGTLVASYGEIEVQMAELAIRCSRLPEYYGLRDNFPFTVAKRTNFLRQAFSCGPLNVYQKVAECALKRVEEATELRHLVAHARMQVQPDWGVVFEHIPTASDGQIAFETKRITLANLELAARKAARLCRVFQKLRASLDKSGKLPNLQP